MKYSIISKYRSELMGMAMLIILLFHAFDIDLGFGFLNRMRNYLFIGVDIFIFLSGLGISMSLSKRDVEFVDYMKRRASRILPSYYIVVIPYTIFYVFAHGGAWSSLIWNCTLLAYWVKPAGMFNWYVTGIMLLYTVAPFWHKFVKPHRHRELKTLAAIIVTLLCTLVLMLDGYWYYLDIIYRVPIFLVGMLIGLYIYEDKPLGAKGIAASAVSILLGAFIFYAGIKFTGYLPPCFAYILIVFPFLLGVCALFELLPLGGLRYCLRVIGGSSLEIYLLNASVFIETELLRRVIHFGPSNRLYYLVIFALNIALGIGFNRLLAKARDLLSSRTAAKSKTA